MAEQNSNSSSATTPRRLVVSDVHGQYDALLAVLELAAPNSSDRVCFLGDLVDRGPKSRQVVDLVRREDYVTLIGNHEQMMIHSFRENGELSIYDLQSWMMNGGETTFNSYQNHLDAFWEDVNWLKGQPYSLDLGDTWLVHAGVNPRVPLEEQNPEDLCWIRDPFHSIEKPYFEDKLIVVGHTITFTFPNITPGNLVQGNGWLGIDTGAYHPKSGWLTIIDIDNWVVYQANIFTQETRTRPYAEILQPYSPRNHTPAPTMPTWPFWFSA